MGGSEVKKTNYEIDYTHMDEKFENMPVRIGEEFNKIEL